MTTAFTLLRDKAEQEQLLLSIITNKLGDSDHKVNPFIKRVDSILFFSFTAITSRDTF